MFCPGQPQRPNPDVNSRADDKHPAYGNGFDAMANHRLCGHHRPHLSDIPAIQRRQRSLNMPGRSIRPVPILHNPRPDRVCDMGRLRTHLAVRFISLHHSVAFVSSFTADSDNNPRKLAIRKPLAINNSSPVTAHLGSSQTRGKHKKTTRRIRRKSTTKQKL